MKRRTTRQREKDENEVANSCVTILAELVGRELGVPPKLRKDGKAFIEYQHIDPKTGKLHTFMRIDVMVRLFEDES